MPTTPKPFRRVRDLIISNPPTGLPLVEIMEAEALIVDGQKIHIRDMVGRINVAIDDAARAESFPMLNPVDDQPLGGEATGAQLFAMIYSWTRRQQAKRDAPPSGADEVPAV